MVPTASAAHLEDNTALKRHTFALQSFLASLLLLKLLFYTTGMPEDLTARPPKAPIYIYMHLYTLYMYIHVYIRFEKAQENTFNVCYS